MPASPPIRPAILRVSARPRPVPPWRRVVEASACSKAWNRALLLRRDAHAGVADLELQLQAMPGLGQQGAGQAHPAPIGELDGVGQQVDEGLGQVLRVARMWRGRWSVSSTSSRPLARACSLTMASAPDSSASRENSMLELHLAGLDLGEVEDVVDHLQQVLGGRSTLRRRSRCTPRTDRAPSGG
jgi:hypothetical protein